MNQKYSSITIVLLCVIVIGFMQDSFGSLPIFILTIIFLVYILYRHATILFKIYNRGVIVGEVSECRRNIKTSASDTSITNYELCIDINISDSEKKKILIETFSLQPLIIGTTVKVMEDPDNNNEWGIVSFESSFVYVLTAVLFIAFLIFYRFYFPR